MKIGRFSGVSHLDYHHGKYKAMLGSSGVKIFRRSPAHYQAYLNEPEKEKSYLNFGNAYHVKILENEQFKKKVVLGLNRARRSNADKAAWAEFEHRHKDKFIISQKESDVISRMHDALMQHQTARDYIEAYGHYEETFIWQNIWGIWCKCRLDKMIVMDDYGIILDLKTAINAMSGPFGRAINTFGYDISAAWYKAGTEMVLNHPFIFVWLVQEKEPPYAVNMFEADQEILDSARNKIRPLMDRFAECMETGKWAAYPEGVHNIRMPGYAYTWNIEEIQF